MVNAEEKASLLPIYQHNSTSGATELEIQTQMTFTCRYEEQRTWN